MKRTCSPQTPPRRGVHVSSTLPLAAALLAALGGCGGASDGGGVPMHEVPQAARDVETQAAHDDAPRPNPLAAVLPSATRYVLVNVNSGMCVEVAGASMADSGNIQQATCTGALSQAFDIDEVSSNVYKLLNANSGKAMDVAAASMADGANIQQYTDNGTTAQQFRLDRTGGNLYTLTNVNSGKCVDVAGASMASGANIQQYACNGTTAQQYYLYPRGATATSPLAIGQYQAKLALSSMCLDVTGASTADGAKTQQSKCKATTNPSEAWEFVGDVGGSYRVTNVNSGKALDVTDKSTAAGALLQQWTAGNSDNQRFDLSASGKGYAMKARNSGLCASVVGDSTTVGAQIEQAACSGKTDQRWTMTALAGSSGGGGSPFGPNVYVFDPTMSSSEIQSQVDSVFHTQEGNQFGTQRYALLFKPGSYNANVKVGFYTTVAGLGMQPDDSTITGTVEANAAWQGGNATMNFWRSTENLGVVPNGGTEKWAVSQASPFRRMHVHGSMVLSDNGWSSGGFIADSKIDNQIDSGSQQQWLTRNSTIGSWTGGGWNMVFVGTQGAPSGANWPNPPYTNVAKTPVVREKPFLIWTGSQYAVFVPGLRTNSSATTWLNATPAGQTLPLSSFYIAQSSTDTATSLNAALAQGKHILFTPGIYKLNASLNVNNPNTVLLGLGIATLEADNGVTALNVADVDGVSIAGLLIDAGTTSSPVLVRMGPTGSSASHAANPSMLFDVFFRIGGAAVGKAATSLQVNSANVIGDDLWIWRGDHTYGVGWNSNTSTNGLVVNGANVTMYGLFVEHHQGYQTLWNGNGGATYFYQSEAPYDVPNQSSWMDGGVNGFASYKVANGVTTHQAWGLGVYCYFSTNGSVKLASAIEAPTPAGVVFHNMMTLALGGGVGEIDNVLNSRGGSTRNSNNSAHLAQ